MECPLKWTDDASETTSNSGNQYPRCKLPLWSGVPGSFKLNMRGGPQAPSLEQANYEEADDVEVVHKTREKFKAS